MGEDRIQWSSVPVLREPVLVAAWPGIGQVALSGVNYLVEKLGVVEFARIDPLAYFDLGGVFVEDNRLQPPRFPQNRFFSWSNPGQGRDLVLFTGDAQPSLHGYQFAHQVLDVAQRLGVRQVYTLAAALVNDFPEVPRVWAATSSPGLEEVMKRQGVVLKGDFYIAGMNGILLAVALERGMEAVCLLGETPRFVPQLENPQASLVVLEVLTRLLGIEVDLEELRKAAQEARAELQRLLLESRKEMIDRFTIPLWEQPDEEERA